MGSPISFVVAEIIMQNVEEQALASYSETLPLWLSYVYCCNHKQNSWILYEYLNKQNTTIQLTKNIEEDGNIPFLDC